MCFSVNRYIQYKEFTNLAEERRRNLDPFVNQPTIESQEDQAPDFAKVY